MACKEIVQKLIYIIKIKNTKITTYHYVFIADLHDIYFKNTNLMMVAIFFFDESTHILIWSNL